MKQQNVSIAPCEEYSQSPEFASLPAARAYMDNTRTKIGLLDTEELIDTLRHLERAYTEFPELETEFPRQELLSALRTTATDFTEQAAISPFESIVTTDPSLLQSGELARDATHSLDGKNSLSRVLRRLCQGNVGAADTAGHVGTDVGHRDGSQEVLTSALVEFLKTPSLGEGNYAPWLGDEQLLDHKGYEFAKIVLSARRRLDNLPADQREHGQALPSKGLLAMAARLRANTRFERTTRHPDLAWPSGEMSFNEFLLQWPCEIELPVDVPDVVFVANTYRAILMREPDVSESDQYVRLLRHNETSRPGLIRSLLASEELFSLQRRLYVIYDSNVITESGCLSEQKMPAMTWPWHTGS